jgi:predicted unusual protein kinase regulating ubiquinone biosynthesis (AarF/ABC1/UbiB family)
MGYVHRDTHYGNFLYQTNTEKGYYHYIFNGKSYYLKSCPYNIMIYDFGFARLKDETRNSKIYVYRDYAKIINAFIKKSSRGWNKLAVLDKSLSETMIQFKRDLYHNIEGELDKDIIANTNTNTNTSSSYAYTQFSFIIEYMFLKHAPPGMFITSRPTNVINAIPFRIDK